MTTTVYTEDADIAAFERLAELFRAEAVAEGVSEDLRRHLERQTTRYALLAFAAAGSRLQEVH